MGNAEEHDDNDTVDDADVDFGNETANSALQEATQETSLPDLPTDCVYGDCGAYELVKDIESGEIVDQPTSSTPSSSTAKPTDKKNDKPRVQVQMVDHESFATLLASSDRSFSAGFGDCTVQLADSIGIESTSSVAYVLSADGDRIGTISTAAPLGSTRGLKATCQTHHQKKMPPCRCWISIRKSQALGAKERLELFQELAKWIAQGTSCDREKHFQDSFILRSAAGMNPRPSCSLTMPMPVTILGGKLQK